MLAEVEDIIEVRDILDRVESKLRFLSESLGENEKNEGLTFTLMDLEKEVNTANGILN